MSENERLRLELKQELGRTWIQCTSRSNRCLGGCATQEEHDRYHHTQLMDENERLRRECIEQEAASLEIAGLLRKAERERDEIASAFAQSERHLENSRDSLATIIDEAFGPQEVLPTMSDLLSRLESLLNAQISKHQTALKELDEARAEVARRDALIKSDGYEDMRQHAQDLALQLEATRLDRDRALVRCREASEVLIAEIGAAGPEDAEETARRAVEHIESRRGVLAEVRLERDTARTGRAAWEQLYNERNRALRTIQDKRERALVELARNGCDCECECDSEGHGDDCEPCLACRLGAILEPGGINS